MTTLIVKDHLTEEDFMRLPDHGRKYELVDGEAKEVPTTLEHDAIGANIVALLMPYARGRGIVTIAQAGFRMQDQNIRCPDVSYTRKERLPGGKAPRTFGSAAPDLAIEIISPSEDQPDIQRKLREYFASGSVLVWHLFPETKQMSIFVSPQEMTLRDEEGVVDAGDLLPGFSCRVGDLFDTGLD